ncbi:Dyp-type peroxidase [Candidatus Poriferisodalis sp.]|uniref:Dyp-type peroxidase n=1 Tax=Candidatus Poriferisodalis sp. TaxID=3101277 RepID=UPI003C6F53EF
MSTAPTSQRAIFADLGPCQWYLHLSRPSAGGSGFDLGWLGAVLGEARAACASAGLELLMGFGPALLGELTDDVPDDFGPYETIESADDSGRRAMATQEELLLWFHGSRTHDVWKAQYDTRISLRPHFAVARETPAFVYGESLDMTGFVDGLGNPDDDERVAVATVPAGEPGAGGSHVNAQRWVHDLGAWERLATREQQDIIGRRKWPGTDKLAVQAPQSHLRHVELRVDGNHGLSGSPERDEMWRRSTPYAVHDGTVGLYFLGFSASQAPLRERMRLMYGLDAADGVRDGLTDYSTPASGSHYFAPSQQTLDAICG